MKKILLLTASIISLSTAHAIAQDEDLNELMDLSLEELLVSVASKRDEKLIDAPGIVNVIGRKEIEASGAQRVVDILERFPEFLSYGDALSPNNISSTRGNVAYGLDRHILYLLNGRPAREGYTSGINNSLKLTFPVAAIERIEFIRGPGSVLYGTNAFAGVVNIVTRKMEEGTEGFEGDTSLTYGSFNTKITDNTFRYQKDDLGFYGGFRIFDTDGWKQNARDFLGVEGNDNHAENNYNFTGALEYKNLTIQYMKHFRSHESFSAPPIFPFTSRHHEAQDFVDIGYEQPLWGTWNANFNASYNDYTQIFDNLANSSTGDFNFEAALGGQTTDTSNLIVGGNYEILRGNDNLAQFNYRTYLANVYAQGDWKPFDWLKLIAGGQINKAESVNPQFSPRIGAIVYFDDAWGAKILYSEAFRAATPFEQFYNVPGFVVASPGTAPETIETADFQIFYDTPDIYAALTAFNSKQLDTIGILPGTIIVGNAEGIDQYGITAELEWQALETLRLKGSASYQENESAELGTEDIFTSPNFYSKAGVTWQPKAGVELDLFYLHIGTATPLPDSNRINPSPGNFNILDANVNVSVPELLNNKNLPDITVSLQVKNILDEESFQPALSFNVPGLAINSFEQRTDRAVFGRVTWKF